MQARHFVVFTSVSIALQGCGKKAAPAPDSAGGEDRPVVTDAAAPSADVTAGQALDGAADASGEVEDEATRRAKLLERVAALEVPGYTRVRGQVQGGFATLQHATVKANAKGSTAVVEATVTFCDGCKPATKEELEGRKDQTLAQYGELHQKNPKLVFDIAELELMPERKGLATYVRSYLDDGETRAAMHSLEVVFSDGTVSVRFFAYPQSPFPQSAAEHDEAMSRAELESAVSGLFTALWPVLYPSR